MLIWLRVHTRGTLMSSCCSSSAKDEEVKGRMGMRRNVKLGKKLWQTCHWRMIRMREPKEFDVDKDWGERGWDLLIHLLVCVWLMLCISFWDILFLLKVITNQYSLFKRMPCRSDKHRHPPLFWAVCFASAKSVWLALDVKGDLMFLGLASNIFHVGDIEITVTNGYVYLFLQMTFVYKIGIYQKTEDCPANNCWFHIIFQMYKYKCL